VIVQIYAVRDLEPMEEAKNQRMPRTAIVVMTFDQRLRPEVRIKRDAGHGTCFRFCVPWRAQTVQEAHG